MLDVRLDDDTLDTPRKHEFSKDADDHDSELEPSHDPSDDGFTFTAVLVGGLNMWRDVVKHLCGIKFPVFVAVLGSVLLVAFSALPGDICITQNVGKVISTICLISESNWVMALHLSVLGTVLGSVCSRSIMRGLQHPIALIMTARLLPVRARAYASGSSRSGAIGAAAAAPSPVTIGYVTDVEGDLGFWQRYCAISEVIDDSGGLDELRLHPGCHFVFGGDSVDKSSGELLPTKFKCARRAHIVGEHVPKAIRDRIQCARARVGRQVRGWRGWPAVGSAARAPVDARVLGGGEPVVAALIELGQQPHLVDVAVPQHEVHAVRVAPAQREQRAQEAQVTAALVDRVAAEDKVAARAQSQLVEAAAVVDHLGDGAVAPPEAEVALDIGTVADGSGARRGRGSGARRGHGRADGTRSARGRGVRSSAHGQQARCHDEGDRMPEAAHDAPATRDSRWVS